jgi:hypothetical protein
MQELFLEAKNRGLGFGPALERCASLFDTKQAPDEASQMTCDLDKEIGHRDGVVPISLLLKVAVESPPQCRIIGFETVMECLGQIGQTLRIVKIGVSESGQPQDQILLG